MGLVRFSSMDALRRWRRGERNRALIERCRAAGRRRPGDAARGAGCGRLHRRARRDHGHGHRNQARQGSGVRAWADRIQKLQATFPGYLGSFVQPPQHRETGWTTVLRFDSAANLDGWLKSRRARRNGEGKRGSRRRIPRAAGRHVVSRVGPERSRHRQPRRTCGRRRASFCSRSFPSSCWSFGFLNPHIEALNPAVRTFIGNAISVGLTTWPLMPLAIFALPRLAVSRRPAALDGVGDADRPGALLPGRDRRSLAPAAVRSRSTSMNCALSCD